MHKVVGVVGMCGSGKSVVTDFFRELGFYCGGVTMEELKKRGMDVNEANERSVREQLRRDLGPAAFAIILGDRIVEAAKEGNTVLDGLYSWQEYVHLKDILGDDLLIVAIVTDRKVRYERLADRPVRPLTAEDARKRDFAEIENLAKGGPIAIADRYITNNGSVEELNEQLRRFVAEME